jgi:tRNA threonylcarbamoyladenosine biosynthesis protein TsaB
VRILALDTATENCSVALFIDGRLVAREALLERGNAEHILPMTDEVLAEAGLALSELTAIAFGRGPGAFTGVRLAASVTQGLAFGAGLPVVPVSDLQAVAQRAFDTKAGVARVLVCSDARMQEVYWGCFERRPDGLAGPIGAERVGKPGTVTLPAAWSSQARAAEDRSGPGGLWGAGSGFRAYPQLREALGARVEGFDEGLLPRAVEIARLAFPEVAAGRFLAADQALPVYLRDEVAQAAKTAVIKVTPH